MKIIKVIQPDNLYARIAESDDWMQAFSQEDLDKPIEKIEHLIKYTDVKVHAVILYLPTKNSDFIAFELITTDQLQSFNLSFNESHLTEEDYFLRLVEH